MWDNELNEVWDALNRLLSPEDMEVLTAEELETYRLEGTDERIPLLEEVLELWSL